MITSGTAFPLSPNSCIAPSAAMYVCRNEAPEVVSAGSSTLIPPYPSRSPSPPATRTKTVSWSTATPRRSSSRNESLPITIRSPSGRLTL